MTAPKIARFYEIDLKLGFPLFCAVLPICLVILVYSGTRQIRLRPFQYKWSGAGIIWLIGGGALIIRPMYPYCTCIYVL